MTNQSNDSSNSSSSFDLSTKLDELDVVMERAVCVSKGLLAFSIGAALSLRFTPKRFYFKIAEIIVKSFDLPAASLEKAVKMVITAHTGSVALAVGVPYYRFELAELNRREMIEQNQVLAVHPLFSKNPTNDDSFERRAEIIRAWQLERAKEQTKK